MKTSLIALCSLLIVGGCETHQFQKTQMKIGVEITFEGDSSYAVSWKDTLGQSAHYLLTDRPYELWCFITKGKDTLGYYRGLSTAQDFCYFSSRDSMVTASFVIGPNYSSENFDETMFNTVQLTHFKPIHLSLQQSARRAHNYMLEEQ